MEIEPMTLALLYGLSYKKACIYICMYTFLFFFTCIQFCYIDTLLQATYTLHFYEHRTLPSPFMQDITVQQSSYVH